MTIWEERDLKPEEDEDEEAESADYVAQWPNYQGERTNEEEQEDQEYQERRKRFEAFEAKFNKVSNNRQFSKYFETSRFPAFGTVRSEGTTQLLRRFTTFP